MKLPMTFTAIAALLAAAPASATVLSFTISGDYSAAFQIDTSAAPDYSDPDYGVGYASVPGFSGTLSGTANIQFFPTAMSGGILIADPDSIDWLLEATGPQLYNGPETAPVFHTGTFALTGLSTPGSFSLTIAPVSAAVPEPASWALMISGFGLAGAALRRRQAVAVRCSIA
jgi:hypothetical protein